MSETGVYFVLQTILRDKIPSTLIAVVCFLAKYGGISSSPNRAKKKKNLDITLFTFLILPLFNNYGKDLTYIPSESSGMSVYDFAIRWRSQVVSLLWYDSELWERCCREWDVMVSSDRYHHCLQSDKKKYNNVSFTAVLFTHSSLHHDREERENFRPRLYRHSFRESFLQRDRVEGTTQLSSYCGYKASRVMIQLFI